MNSITNFPKAFFFQNFSLKRDFENRGVGKDLVQSVLNISYQEHFEYFSLTHDPHEKYLTKFYESFGFILNGATRAGNVRMIKSRKIIAY
jgi:ribosomal protein S18 acetylase RimI-like enzyme